MKRKNYSKYNKFARLNKHLRESFIAPNAFEKFENKGISGKVISLAGERVIEKPIHSVTYEVVGTIYDKKKHIPYIGSVLYTIFKWFLLFVLVACPPLLFIMIATGIY